MSTIQNLSNAHSLPFSAPLSSNPFESKGAQQSAEQVAADFETVFTSIMLKELRKSLEPGSLFGEDSSDIYGGMFDQFLGQHMANAGGIGLASMVRQSLVRSKGDEPINPNPLSQNPNGDVSAVAN